MTSAQPPSDGDGPAAGQEAAPPEAAGTEATTPEGAAPEGAASESAAPDSAAPSAPRTTPKRTTARRTPAARKQGDFEAPVKRTPSTRKRSTATSISPNGEAPEILDAMLGKSAPAPAADTSASPAEPVAPEPVAPEPVAPAAVASEAVDDVPGSAEPGRAVPWESTAQAGAPEPPETATAALPSAADFYREPTIETEVLAPAADGMSSDTATPPVVGETPATDATPPGPDGPTAPAEGTAPAPDAAGAERADGTRPARSVNELADRLDDSRFFSSLFDFTFTSYVTRKLAGPVYVVGLVLIGLGIVVGFANSLGIAIAANSPGGAFVFLLGVLVTLVAAILSVLLLRVTIEVFCAIIEIAQNTRRRRPPRD